MPARSFTRTSALVAVALGTLGTTPITAGPHVDAAVSVMGPGRTLLVSPEHLGRDGQRSTAPAISDDGRTVAYQRVEGLRGRTVVEVHDTLTGARTSVGDRAQDSTAPTVSGDGTLVAFQTMQTPAEDDHQRPDERADIDIWTTNLSLPGRPTRRVTGTRHDLRHQRVLGCDPASGEEAEVRDADRCGPQLSDDGTAIAFEALFSLVVPQLRFAVRDGEGSAGEPVPAHGHDHTARSVRVLDFGPDATTRRLEVTVTGRDPVRFTSAVVELGSEAFRIVDPPATSTPCVGSSVAPDETCVLDVEMVRGQVCGPVVGRLLLNSPTPRGQTEISLAGEDDGGCTPPPPPPPPPPQSPPSPPPSWEPYAVWSAGKPSSPPSPDPAFDVTTRVAASTGCPEPERLEAPMDPAEDEYDEYQQVHHLGEVLVGEDAVVAQRLRNDTAGDVVVGFASTGCDLGLVRPHDDPGPEEDPVCNPGLVLPARSGCVAYVRFRPRAVESQVATLSVASHYPADPPGVTTRVVRFTGAGMQNAVVLRRDPRATGRFRTDSQVVSLDEDGNQIDGYTPSLSADGRYVAFTSTRNHLFPSSQVLVHDTDRDGDGSHRRGGTVVASRLSDGSLAEEAYQPSLSGDGTRVAFGVRAVEIDLREKAAARVHSRQVWVRDLATGTSVLASAPGGSERGGSERGGSERGGSDLGGDGPSWAPSLSRDGSTVAFASDARALVPKGGKPQDTAVYVRDLGPDFGGPGEPGAGIVSLRPDDDTSDHPAGLPAMDGIGAVTAFQTADRLLSDGERWTERVYLRTRHGDPSATPGRVEFPTLQLGTDRPVESVEVVNSGPGPARLSAAALPPYRLQSSCPPVLHRDELCTIEVDFVPTTVGRHPGRLTITSGGPDWSDLDVVRLVGEAVPLPFAAQPATLSFPETAIGQRSKPKRLRLTNVLDVPLTVHAATLADVADFEASPSEPCIDLQPGATCTVRVVFTPAGLGERSGVIDVTAFVGDQEPVTRTIPLDGLTATPQVTFSPTVAQEGRVTFVRGTHFPPGRMLLLNWSRTPVALPVVVPDDEGAFEVPVVLIRGAGAGPRDLSVVMPGIAEPVEAPPLLVVPGSLQPPDFVTRN